MSSTATTTPAMNYTTLGRTGLTVSRLGFGCMRLPMAEGGKVDRDKAIPLLHRAVELGVIPSSSRHPRRTRRHP